MSLGSLSEQRREAVGERLGRYELIELLGAGGMAEVFRARCRGPGGFQRTVVVKRILPANSRDPSFAQMFVAEAKLLGMLHHPNVIQAYDFGESAGTLFLVLEYVEGPSLGQTLSVLRGAGRHMPVGVACQVARDICLALDHVHNLRDADGAPLNVVHRDVTPSNILLTATGAAKLLDFGVAKYRASQAGSQVGTIKGKPAYLAPETLEKQSIDHRGDIFSLGVVLYELLTAQPLFDGDNHQAIFYRLLNMEIPPPSRARRDIPGELDAIVLKALERDPGRRYQSAQEMARDLDELLVQQAFRSEDAIGFVRGVTDLIVARRQQNVLPPAGALVTEESAAPAMEEGAPTIRTKARRNFFGERFRKSRIGRFLLRH